MSVVVITQAIVLVLNLLTIVRILRNNRGNRRNENDPSQRQDTQPTSPLPTPSPPRTTLPPSPPSPSIADLIAMINQLPHGSNLTISINHDHQNPVVTIRCENELSHEPQHQHQHPHPRGPLPPYSPRQPARPIERPFAPPPYEAFSTPRSARNSPQYSGQPSERPARTSAEQEMPPTPTLQSIQGVEDLHPDSRLAVPTREAPPVPARDAARARIGSIRGRVPFFRIPDA